MATKQKKYLVLIVYEEYDEIEVKAKNKCEAKRKALACSVAHNGQICYIGELIDNES